MTDEKDPYELSSDSSDDLDSDVRRKPPPKIAIEGRSDVDFQRIKNSLTAGQNAPVKDEKTLEEIAELKRIKADELSRFKHNFETGTVSTSAELHNEESTNMPGSEPPTGIDRQVMSAFKEKFENMNTSLDISADERAEKALEGMGKESLANVKNIFERQQNKEFIKGTGVEDELLGMLQQRSDTEKRRLRSAFDPNIAVVDSDELKDCHICGKMVYPVEKIIASKKLYHNTCFKCAICRKKLSAMTYNVHQGTLYCRPHMLDVLHPERAGTTRDDDNDDDDSDNDDEFAVSSKPKRHSSDVVQAGGTSVGDELSALRAQLQNKKQKWQESVNETVSSAHSQSSHVNEIAAGSVRANLDRFTSNATENNTKTEEEEEKQKQLDAIRNQINEVKNKWKTGDKMGEKAEISTDALKNEELEALKGLKVCERFTKDAAADSNVIKSYDRSELDNSNASEARRSFLEGHAFQSGPVEKISANELQDLKFEGLRSFKMKFEKGDTNAEESSNEAKEKLSLELDLKAIKQALERSTDNTDDMSSKARAERKKQEIEAEFLRYKVARKLQAKWQAEQAAIAGKEAESKESAKNGLDVDIKIAGKAREKFKNIDAQSYGAVPIPKPQHQPAQSSKWSTKNEVTAEIINRRTVEDDESSSEDDNFDVKNLMNKFKNIENISPNKAEHRLDELEALRIEAKNLRQRFEQSFDDAEQNEERKRQLEEEFRHLKVKSKNSVEERERAQKDLEEERLAAAAEEAEIAQKDDVQIAEAHASKMTAKWEKIQKKEAKKAQKSQMPQKTSAEKK